MLRAFRAGASAMVACIVRELGIPKTIDSLVAWDPKQCKHSPGTHVLAMIANILMGRTALYGVEEQRFRKRLRVWQHMVGSWSG